MSKKFWNDLSERQKEQLIIGLEEATFQSDDICDDEDLNSNNINQDILEELAELQVDVFNDMNPDEPIKELSKDEHKAIVAGLVNAFLVYLDKGMDAALADN